MKRKRIEKVNSLLKEVISEVITREVKNPGVSTFITVTRVEISPDLRYAKVFISVIGSEEEKQKTLKAVQSASGFIGIRAAKQVVLRYFPSLTFYLDQGIENQMRIQEILGKIENEREERQG